MDEFISFLNNEYDKNPFVNISDVVYKYLLNGILEFKYVPGEQLIEYKLAKLFKISRTPIHQALEKLQLYGFIEKDSKGIAVVAKYSDYVEIDLHTVRAALEPLAASQAAERITDKELNQLFNLLINLDKAFDKGIINDIMKADESFHNLIIKCSRNKFIQHMYYTLNPMINKYRRKAYINTSSTSNEKTSTHTKINTKKIPFSLENKGYKFLSYHGFEHYLVYEGISTHNKYQAEIAMIRHMSTINNLLKI